jgi:hypothetical protein
MVYDVIIYTDYNGKEKLAHKPRKKDKEPVVESGPVAYDPWTGEYE